MTTPADEQAPEEKQERRPAIRYVPNPAPDMPAQSTAADHEPATSAAFWPPAGFRFLRYHGLHERSRIPQPG